jgi:hypothetical protein
VSGVLTCGRLIEDDTLLCAEDIVRPGGTWRVTARGEMTRIATSPSELDLRRPGADGRIALASRSASRISVLDSRNLSGARLSIPAEPERYITDVATVGDHVASITIGTGGSTLTLYRVDSSPK